MIETTRSSPLLEARDLVQEFSGRRRAATSVVQAVSGVSLHVAAGEALGLVGETGSGKSTLARALLQIPPPKSGAVLFRGRDLTQLRGARLLEHRRGLQMVFQDPLGSLDRKWCVRDIVEEPLRGYGAGNRAFRQRRIIQILDLVGLPHELYGHRRPTELSGGQCQRVAIARALSLDPALIVCDEALSSLDVLTQAQILSLFQQLRSEIGLSYLFISHDLAAVRNICERVAVLHLGQLCEVGPTRSIFAQPAHPYTAALLDSVPRSADMPATARSRVTSTSPSPLEPPSGCRFRTRCSAPQARCATDVPRLAKIGDEHFVACHFPLRAEGKVPIGAQTNYDARSRRPEVLTRPLDSLSLGLRAQTSE